MSAHCVQLVVPGQLLLRLPCRTEVVTYRSHGLMLCTAKLHALHYGIHGVGFTTLLAFLP